MLSEGLIDNGVEMTIMGAKLLKKVENDFRKPVKQPKTCKREMYVNCLRKSLVCLKQKERSSESSLWLIIQQF